MKFNESNQQCSYIQNLLASTYIPTIRLIKNISPEEVASATSPGEVFIYNGFICKHTETYDEKTNQTIPGYEIIDTYLFGKRYDCITKNFIAKNNYYSSELHEALGDYLRFYCDYHDMKIMPLYNCFSNKFVDNFSLPISYNSTNDKLEIPSGKTNKRVIAVPIKLDREYSIWCSKAASGTFQFGLYNNKDYLTPFRLNGKPTKDNIISAAQSIALNFVEPQILSLKSDTFSPEQLAVIKSQSKYLHLFLELNIDELRSLVILENNNERSVINNTLLLDEYNLYPFSDKLFSYLNETVISPADPIKENIMRIQAELASNDFNIPTYIYNNDTITESASQPGRRLKNYTKGNFDEATLSFIYNTYRNAGISDFTGYVDRDVEYLIMNHLTEDDRIVKSGIDKITIE